MISQVDIDEIESVADIGCGEGSNLLYLSDKFPRADLFGFDISSTALERARSRVEANFSFLNIERETADQQFDFVFCSDVLEHISDDQSAIKNIYGLTGKYALISSVQGRMRESETRIGHVRSYAPGELRGKLEHVGFKLLRVAEWGFPLYSLYRDLVDIRSVQDISYGRYGLMKRAVCNVLYALFMMNRSDRGDVIIALVRK
jgi:SAM-dependent methyltransferase